MPLTDPRYFSDPRRCSGASVAEVFAPVSSSREGMPLLSERIAVIREVGSILCERFGGSFQGMLGVWKEKYGEGRTALQLVEMVTEAFPSFRDEAVCNGRRGACLERATHWRMSLHLEFSVYFWKRAQILVAETW